LPRTARRAQLLESAQAVFVAQGYHAAGMDEIAERAGVSKPVLYQHFPGKLDLYTAVIEQHAEELVATVRTALGSTHDNRLRVANAIAAYFDFVDRDGEAFRLLFENDLRGQPVVADVIDAALSTCALELATVIAADTDLPEAEARLLASGLAGLAEISARTWLAAGGASGPVSRDRAVELAGRLLWRGIAGFPGPSGSR
jgi:AcrR family transcriptional regulator